MTNFMIILPILPSKSQNEKRGTRLGHSVIVVFPVNLHKTMKLFLEGGDHLLLLSISMIFVNGRLVATLVELVLGRSFTRPTESA